LGVQLALGVGIVVLGVPLAVAVAHNGVAALLLLSLIHAHQRIWHD
jgi:cytochrome c oxidase assembly protein subunit 15